MKQSNHLHVCSIRLSLFEQLLGVSRRVIVIPDYEICEMIKGNESDVGHIAFEIGKNSVQIPLFHIVFSIVKSFITL